MNDVEFEPGDEVTYKPYAIPIKSGIDSIQVGSRGDGFNMFGEPDDRIFYKLKANYIGHSGTITTGTCIVESKHYLPSNWSVVLDKESEGLEDEVIETNLTLTEAEDLLCRMSNEGAEAYLREE